MNAVKEMSIDDIKALQKHYQGLIQDDDKMQKQSISMGIILAADKIATDQLFLMVSTLTLKLQRVS